MLAALHSNQWVTFADQASISVSSIPAGVGIPLATPLVTQINLRPGSYAIGPAFTAIGELDHRVTVTRVNQTFRTTDAQVTPFLVEVSDMNQVPGR